MKAPYCERAIEDALHHGNALLKFISPNNVGLTGSHECGFYLPISVWQMYTPHAPVPRRSPEVTHLCSDRLTGLEGPSRCRKMMGDKALSSPLEAGCLGQSWRANPGHFSRVPHAPVKGKNDKHPVSIVWQDGRRTDSVITSYGAAKHEYRLTRSGKDFPLLGAG